MGHAGINRMSPNSARDPSSSQIPSWPISRYPWHWSGYERRGTCIRSLYGVSVASAHWYDKLETVWICNAIHNAEPQLQPHKTTWIGHLTVTSIVMLDFAYCNDQSHIAIQMQINMFGFSTNRTIWLIVFICRLSTFWWSLRVISQRFLIMYPQKLQLPPRQRHQPLNPSPLLNLPQQSLCQ